MRLWYRSSGLCDKSPGIRVDGQDRRYSAVLKGLFFSLRAFTATQKYSKIKNPDRALSPTQIIERIQCRTNLLTDLGLWVDVLKSVNQRGIFGTQLFSQLVDFLKQRIEFLGISRLVSLLHLVTELGCLAIDSSLGFVAADYFEPFARPPWSPSPGSAFEPAHILARRRSPKW